LHNAWIKVGKEESPICAATAQHRVPWGGASPGLRGPPPHGLPFPHLRGRLQQVTWKMMGRVVPRRRQPNGPAPAIGADGPRFVYIWAKRGARVGPRVPPRPPRRVTSAF